MLLMVTFLLLLFLTFLGTLGLAGHDLDGFWSALDRLAAPGASIVALSLAGAAFALTSLTAPGPWKRLKRLRNFRHYIPLWWVALSATSLWLLGAMGVSAFRGLLGLPPLASLRRGENLGRLDGSFCLRPVGAAWFLELVGGLHGLGKGVGCFPA
jgi:hypothetical protein